MFGGKLQGVGGAAVATNETKHSTTNDPIRHKGS